MAVLIPLYYIVPGLFETRCVSKSLNVMLNMWKNLAMMLAIVSGTTLLFYKTSAKNWLIKIAPYGKMSLTNYLTQSIFGAMLFYNWGFFLMGVGLVILQYLFCTWWLKNHKRGPFEELWSQATWIGRK